MNQEQDKTVDELSFSEAMEELERILRGGEAEESDIDALGDELKRAAELLEMCRAKIRRAEVEVTQIVQSLEEGTPKAGDEPEPEESEGASEGGGSGSDEELPF